MYINNSYVSETGKYDGMSNTLAWEFVYVPPAAHVHPSCQRGRVESWVGVLLARGNLHAIERKSV